MPLLDLGFSSFEAAGQIIAREQDYKLSYIWMCDWELISFLNKITFVCDATMYRMYCAEYDIACDYSDEECAELANKYKNQLITFQCDILSQLVDKIHSRWLKFAETGVARLELPPTAKTAMLNFVSIATKMAESELPPHFISMFASLAEAHRERTSCDFDVSDIQESITKDQFLSYCNLFKGLFARLFQFKDDSLDQKLFNVRIGFVQKVLMSILWICEPQTTNRCYSADSLFDKWIWTYIARQNSLDDIISKYRSRKSIPLAYALCVNPETIYLIPEDRDSYPVTDSFRFMSTLLLANQTVE